MVALFPRICCLRDASRRFLFVPVGSRLSSSQNNLYAEVAYFNLPPYQLWASS